MNPSSSGLIIAAIGDLSFNVSKFCISISFGFVEGVGVIG